ncbi:DddA-like double-stranded DNA deaminase toxin [Saccharothrix lopnurensis]|uniref:DddA-like double-stranded DNA deaminase toxin n=1 Tax=Saccharothrix lopnurensis TaxID=1670621 RepID=A0ABW1P984_9PSEU
MREGFPHLGLRRGLPTIAAHVETKLAAYMRNHDVRAATLIINNWPCEDGPLTGEQVVPALLPEGHALTVYGPNGFNRTYRGGATPPWRTR